LGRGGQKRQGKESSPDFSALDLEGIVLCEGKGIRKGQNSILYAFEETQLGTSSDQFTGTKTRGGH